LEKSFFKELLLQNINLVIPAQVRSLKQHWISELRKSVFFKEGEPVEARQS
jgi:hypothetical protein